MRRLARPLLLCGIAAAVFGLSKAHATAHGYDYTESFRFLWSGVYSGLLLGRRLRRRLPSYRHPDGRRRSRLRRRLRLRPSPCRFSSCSPARRCCPGSWSSKLFLLVPFAVLCSSAARRGTAREGQRDRVVAVAGPEESANLDVPGATSGAGVGAGVTPCSSSSKTSTSSRAPTGWSTWAREGGDGGGTVVVEGTPVVVAKTRDSYTGKFLADVVATEE